LVELKAPDGYQLPAKGQFLNKADSENNEYSLTVTNNTTYELPETGGAGTGWFLLSGTVAIMMSAYLYFLERRRKGYN
jgi:LPXTG-motif cell wall-anchored protein